MSLSIPDYQLQLEQEIKQIQKSIQDIEGKIGEIEQNSEFKKMEIRQKFSQNDFSGNDNWLTIEHSDLETQLETLSESEVLDLALEIFDLN